MTRTTAARGASLALLVAIVAGCSKEPTKPAPTAGTPPAMPAASDKDADIQAAINQLPEGERAAAIAQGTCPVGGEALGSMGMPYKVTVEGRDVYLCCEGCKGEIEKDPAKYLAKLDEAKSEPEDKPEDTKLEE